MYSLPRRDADGKYAPKFGRTWAKKELHKQQREPKRRQQIANENREWCAQSGINPDDAWMIFA